MGSGGTGKRGAGYPAPLFWFRRARTREVLTAYVLIAPHMLALGVFTFFAMGFAFYLGFHRYDLLSPPTFVGIKNFVRILTDRDFHIALRNTLYYTAVVVPVQTALALFYAVLLNQPVRFRTFFRAAFYAPSVTASIVISLVFIWLYAKQGIFNYLLTRLGLPATIDWLGNPATALPAIMMMNIWSTAPTFMVVFLAALQDIPDSLLEAAAIDGANAWQRFTRVTLPLLRPSIFFVVVMGTIGCLQVFDQIYIMTRGGPLKSTMTINYLIYSEAFENFRMGYAAALSLILFVLILLLTLIQKRYIDVEVQY
ncbi:carbohydrate ABC transporter permease [Candidatus Bipolaricaulota sp. J31]